MDGGLLMKCLCGCEMDVTTDVSVMVMGLAVEVLAAYEAVQMPSLSGEPREGDGERRGGAGRGREGAAGPVGGDLLRAGQAAVEPRLRRAGCEEPLQVRVDTDLRAARPQSGRIALKIGMVVTSDTDSLMKDDMAV